MTGALPFFDVREHGGVGDGATLNSRAFQAAIDACARAGGGTVYVPAGRYVTGALFLHSHTTLYLDAGATLLGSQNPADYPAVASRWEGAEQETHAALITGQNLDRVAVAGRGTIDGQGACWWEWHRAGTLKRARPRLVEFTDSTDVHLEGVTLTDSPSWTVHPLRCENVTVAGITIRNPADSPNTDGINPDSCRNVHIMNCHIDVGDDCIALKSGTEQEGRARLTPCENITITNCTLVHGHGGVVIGSEMSGGVRNVVISNCIMTGTDRGIRLKSRRGRGGFVEDIRVANVIMREVLCPFTMNLYYHIGVKGNREISDKRPRPVDEGTPRFRHIHYSHITARDAQYAAAFLYGLPEMPIEDVSFSDVSIALAAEADAGAPEMADDIPPMRRAGFFARNVAGLRLDRVEITGQEGEPFLLASAE